MSKLSTLLCFVASGLVMVAQAHAAEPVLVTEADTEMSLGLHLEYLEDKEGTLTLEDVLKPEVAAQFVKSQVESPSFGFSDSSFWFSFELINDGRGPTEHLIEIGYPVIDHLEIYLLDASGVVSRLDLGDTLAFSKRPVQHRNFVVPLMLQAGQPLRVIARMTTSSSARFPVKLWAPQYFYETDAVEVTVQGLYYGVMLVMALYNLFVFFSIRERAYLYYVLFVFTAAGLQAGLGGFNYQHLWPTQPWWAGSSLMVFLALSPAFAGLFTREFLHLPETSKNLGHVTLALALAGLVMGFASLFLPYATAIRLNMLIALPCCPVWVVAGVVQWRAGVLEARYYTMAWISFLIGAFVLALVITGHLLANDITNRGHQIGAAMLVVLLSLALARKLKTF